MESDLRVSICYAMVAFDENLCERNEHFVWHLYELNQHLLSREMTSTENTMGEGV